MGGHVREMVIHLSDAYAHSGAVITPVIETTGATLPVTRAIPCALALNELVSNVFKHAFREGEVGRLEVLMKKSGEGRISIRVKDDGIGIPEGIDIDKVTTLGLKLARDLVVHQLGGEMEIRRDMGTEVSIGFEIMKRDS